MPYAQVGVIGGDWYHSEFKRGEASLKNYPPSL